MKRNSIARGNVTKTGDTPHAMSMGIEYIYVNIYTNNIYEYLRLIVKKNAEHVAFVFIYIFT